MRHVLPLLALATITTLAACATPGGNGPRAAGERFRDCADCPEMVVVPAGRFTMGFDGGEPERYEGPVHAVAIVRSFAAGRTEVTVGQFRRFVAATGHRAARGCNAWDGKAPSLLPDADWADPGYGRPPRDDEPVACVDWQDAAAYVRWLATTTGQPYRLLTEAEWEYAAKAGSTASFPWGEDPAQACRHANVYDESAARDLAAPIAPAACDDGFPRVAPVGQLQANAFGLHDMTGNVWEWVQDCYAMPYPADVPVDGSAQTRSGCDRRSVRGGSWITAVSRQRPTFRGRDPVDLVSQIFGFRVARDLGAE
jgi:formylglycine-generating enzyme required for sulfatase activity